MRRVWKKALTILVAAALLAGTLQTGGPGRAEAAVAHTQAEALQWARAQVGKSLDYDGVYGAQCVDLIAYYYQYLGMRTPGGNAIDYAGNRLPDGWARRTSDFQPGDIAVWYANHGCNTCYTGSYGHIGIIVSVDGSYINVIDQNGPKNKGVCAANRYLKSAIKCVIRPDFSAAGNASRVENSPIFSNVRAEEVTETSAKIMTDYTRDTYGDIGFYFGTSGQLANMTKVSEYKYSDIKTTTTYGNSYQLGVYYDDTYGYKWWPALTWSTTYYYAFYCVKNGVEHVSAVQSFLTAGPASGVVHGAGIHKLSYDEANIKAVGKQGSSQCLAYALAYSRTILDGRVHQGSEYWQPGVGGVAGRAAYTASGASNKQAMLRIIYDQINAGQPVCLWVTGRYRQNRNWNASGDHWVTVVGYKPAANPNSLTESDFYILDPGSCSYDWLSDGCTKYDMYSLKISQAGAGLVSPYKSVWVDNISEGDATIHADLTSTLKIGGGGFYISTDPNMAGSRRIYEELNQNQGTMYIWYGLNKWYGALTPGTTYYYQFYIMQGGQEVRSDVYSLTTAGSKPVSNPFQDVQQGAWYNNAVIIVYVNGYMSGKGDGSFSPEGLLTRGEIATVLYNMSGRPSAQYISHFEDIPFGQWYSEPVSWVYENGIAAGYGDTGLFGVGDRLTREQLAVMLYQYARKYGGDLSYSNTALDRFPDKNQVSSWAVEAMKWAVSKQIINGTGDGYLKPNGNATRAECASVVGGYSEKVQ